MILQYIIQDIFGQTCTRPTRYQFILGLVWRMFNGIINGIQYLEGFIYDILSVIWIDCEYRPKPLLFKWHFLPSGHYEVFWLHLYHVIMFLCQITCVGMDWGWIINFLVNVVIKSNILLLFSKRIYNVRLSDGRYIDKICIVSLLED